MRIQLHRALLPVSRLLGFRSRLVVHLGTPRGLQGSSAGIYVVVQVSHGRVAEHRPGDDFPSRYGAESDRVEMRRSIASRLQGVHGARVYLVVLLLLLLLMECVLQLGLVKTLAVSRLHDDDPF